MLAGHARGWCRGAANASRETAPAAQVRELAGKQPACTITAAYWPASDRRKFELALGRVAAHRRARVRGLAHAQGAGAVSGALAWASTRAGGACLRG